MSTERRPCFESGAIFCSSLSRNSSPRDQSMSACASGRRSLKNGSRKSWYASFHAPGAWKEAYHDFLEPFFRLRLPEAHADIDWSRGLEFLDNELQKIAPDSKQGRRSVDILVRVWRRSGEEQWVLIHIEVQAQYDADFPWRIYQYNYRILDRYGKPVASFAVLADDNPNWKPDRFTSNLWGCKIDFQYPVIKLTDFDTAKLEQSDNPFAIII